MYTADGHCLSRQKHTGLYFKLPTLVRSGRQQRTCQPLRILTIYYNLIPIAQLFSV